jgi:Ca2+-binding EF-hand superfamily protein
MFEETLMQTFRLLDLKKTGFIEPSDLAAVGNIVGENLNEEEALRLLKLADVMDLNKLSYNEFHSFFLKDIKPDT